MFLDIIIVVVSKMLDVAVFDIWDALEGLLLAVVAVACFVLDRARKRA